MCSLQILRDKNKCAPVKTPIAVRYLQHYLLPAYVLR